MKVIFIAGPFRAANPWLVEQNIRKAEELSFKVWELGAAAICPHTNTRFFDKTLPDEIFLDGIQQILLRCDAVVLVEGFEKSSGTMAEVNLALSKGIPVFKTLEELEEWLRIITNY